MVYSAHQRVNKSSKFSNFLSVFIHFQTHVEIIRICAVSTLYAFSNHHSMILFVNASLVSRAMVYHRGIFSHFVQIIFILIKIFIYFSCFAVGESPQGVSLVYARGTSIHRIPLKSGQEDLTYTSRIAYIPGNICDKIKR